MPVARLAAHLVDVGGAVHLEGAGRAALGLDLVGDIDGLRLGAVTGHQEHVAVVGFQHHALSRAVSRIGALSGVVLDRVGHVREIAVFGAHGHGDVAPLANGVLHRVLDGAHGDIALLAHLHVHLHRLAVHPHGGLLHPGLARSGVAHAVRHHEHTEQTGTGRRGQSQRYTALLRLLHRNALYLSDEVSRGMDLAHHGFVPVGIVHRPMPPSTFA